MRLARKNATIYNLCAYALNYASVFGQLGLTIQWLEITTWQNLYVRCVQEADTRYYSNQAEKFGNS